MLYLPKVGNIRLCRYDRMMTFYKLLFTIITTCAAVTRCSEDCVFNVKHGDKYLHFDLNSLKDLKTTNFTNVYSVNIKLCKSNEQTTACDGIKSKVCLIPKNKNPQRDIGSKIKELKLSVKNQLIMSLEGNTMCKKNRKYTTDITFVCSRNNNEDKFINKPSEDDCKYITELISTVACPIDDWDIRKVCSDISIPHSHHKFDLSPLRRLTNNYLVENQNRRFEINICGRLNYNNTCRENITTICDVTDVIKPKVYAVGSKNDQLIFDTKSRRLTLIQHERASKNNKGKRIEIVFKCNESIPVEDTKPVFLYEDNYRSKSKNIARFEVATSVVCIPRITSCENYTSLTIKIFTNTARYNLKTLHKRVGNWIFPNEKNGGKFYLNVCDYLNQYDEKIPTSCSDGKTSVCYEYSPGKGIPIGSTQIGPYYAENSILLNYTDGGYCTKSLKWSTVIKFTCSDESQLTHHSTNSNLCIYVFQWKSPEACEILFERKGPCMVTHPQFSNTIFNMSYLKDQSFEVQNNEDDETFLISICSPLQTPCNGNLDSAICWLFNGNEKNIGSFNEEIVFDDSKIYMSMQGEKCDENGPNSFTSIRFLCDYLDSKKIDFVKDLRKCTFEFFIYTKHACTPATKVNCSVNDVSGNVYDLSKLTKLNSNYEIMSKKNPKKKIILNVCHSVINNEMNKNNCQFNSGVCLVDSSHVITSSRFKNLGDVYLSPRKEGNTILLEMTNGFYDSHVVSSVIEFTCSNTPSRRNNPELINEENHKYTFKWYTPLVCPSVIQKREITLNAPHKPKHFFQIDGSNYTIHICPKKYEAGSDCNLGESDSYSQLPGPAIVIIANGKKIIEYLSKRLTFTYHSDKICGHNNRTKKINFYFMCGYESQIPKIEDKTCISNVLIIDPEMCKEKLQCKVKSYDLTPIKGSYVVFDNGGVKYFINLCKAGEGGNGGQMELDGKNVSMGYQVSSPLSEVSDTIEIDYLHGDECAVNTYRKYSTKIRVICDVTETKGELKFIETNDKCSLIFEWKTIFLCSKKMMAFNTLLCTATFVDYQIDLDGPKMLNMTNILSIHEFFDNTTNIIYHVNFCNEYGIRSNSSKLFGNMSLQYNVYKTQLIACLKSINDSMIMNIIITCSNITGKLPEVLSTRTETTINTYSEGVCCLGDISYTNETCKNYLLTSISSTTTTIGDLLATDIQNYESSDEVEYLKPRDQEKSPLITKSSMHSLNKHSNLPLNERRTVVFSNITRMQSMEKNVSSSPFNYSGLVLMVLVLVLTFFIWFYRWKLRRELQKLFNYSPLRVTRRRRSLY